MKRKFKGFTLVECIVAIAILGVASLVMAQIYASVSVNNKMNHLVNTSLSNQMKYVEEAAGAESVELKFNNGGAYPSGSKTTPPHKLGSGTISTYDNYVTVTKLDPSGAPTTDQYSYPVNIYVLKSRDRSNTALSSTGDAGYTEQDYNLRYKYFLGT